MRERDNAAVRECAEKSDKWLPPHSRLDEEQIKRIVATVSEQALAAIKTAIKTVQDHVRAFAQNQREYLAPFDVGTEPGSFLEQRNIPVVAATAFDTEPLRQRLRCRSQAAGIDVLSQADRATDSAAWTG
ncbi:hypothetical protein [Streptomyces sp. SD15]